jgi:chromosome partitioning protein
MITVCSPKGGVGKTTIARCLLVAGAQAGMRAVGLDFDPQQSLTKWADRRGKASRALADQAFARIEVAPCDLADWRRAVSDHADAGLLVVDTPPGVEANLPAIKGLCENATIVFVPTGTTRDDLDSVLPWMHQLLDAKLRASFVLNKVNRRTISFDKARGKLMKVGPICPIEIPALEEIHSQSDNGLTVLDLTKSKGHEPMEGLWTYARREMAA